MFSLGGYLFYLLPLFFTEKPLFLHHYLPSLIFKYIALATFIDHLFMVTSRQMVIDATLIVLVSIVLWNFVRFLPLSYGYGLDQVEDILQLKWKNTWNLIVRRT